MQSITSTDKINHNYIIICRKSLWHNLTWRIDAFELWCWRRLLRVPWTARRSNESILKEINPGCPLEEMMLKLKLQDFGCLMRRVDSLEKTLMLGGIGGRGEGDNRGWDGWMASPTQWTWVWVNSEFTQTHVPWVSDTIQPSHPLPPIPPSIRVFSNESTLRMRWPKYWSFSFSIIPSKGHPGLIFRMDWLDLLAVQGTLKSQVG